MRKHKLFLVSLVIALCGISQTFAADWSAATLEAGKHYFLNVGANKWWGAGNSWGTQASLLPHPEYLTVIVDGSNYKIESQVSNGGTNYYFNGSYMDNGSPVSLTIETDGTNYSIANGTTYYGYDGSSTVLATSDNRDSDNFKWQIFSEAQMRARLEAASSSNPVDATYLILNQGFGRNNRNTGAWTMDASNKNLAGGDNTNLCAESYHSIFTLSQKIENVPNGLYTLTAQGFYRQDGSDNDNLPYFYINDAKGTFPILSGSENNMTDASNSFTAGKYTISPISVLVTDGTITLGAKNEVNTSLWCIFDNFTLTFYGDTDPLEASKTLIKAAIDEAEAIDVTGLPTAVVDEMKAIVETYKTAYESYTTQAEFDQAIVAIQTAINKVKAYNNAKDCVAKLKALLEETNVYTQEAYETIYANVTKFENAELTVDEANAMNGAIFGTGWRSTAAIDDFLISAWDVDARNWDSYHVNTWSTEGNADGSNFTVPFIEYWFNDAEVLAAKTMTATVPGLKAGQEYEVSALVRVRNSNDKTIAPGTILFQVGEGTSVDVTAGTQIGTSQLYIGTYTAKGTADAEGNLVVKFTVAEGSNVSWLAFKNVKYTEVAPAYTEVANIADLKKLENGTEFKLTLKDAKVTVQTFSMRGIMILLEDATGAIDASEMSALEGFVEQNVLNGTLYGVYRNEFGTIGLGLSENTEKSEITAHPGVVTPTKFTIADVKNDANYYKFVELNDCKAVQDESYTWWAFVGTDSIAITDRFNKAVNWDTGEMEIPANIKSMTGIVMFDGEKWVICPYAYGENKAIVAEPQPEDIVVNVTEGDIAAAVEAAKAEVAKVGKITINLTEGAAYTIANSIVAPAGVVINGNGATVDATALAGAIISLNGTESQALNQDGTENANYKMIDSVAINNVVVKSLVHPIVKDAQKTLVGKLVVDNSVIEISGSYNVFDFASKGYPTELSVNNSTIWSKDGHKGYLLQAGGRVKDLDPSQTEYKQIISIANSTLHKISVGKQFNNLSGKGQKSLVLSITSTIISDCTVNGNEVRGWLGGQNSNNPSVTYDKNTYWAEGAVQAGWTNGSQGSDATGTSLTTAPGFKDAANGDFTLDAASDQNINKTGDPRWLVIVKAGSVAYLCGATETNEAIYNALVAADYDVTPLNYDNVTLTEEIVNNDFAGKYDVVVLAGATGSGTNLAKSANLLLGKVNVLSTKSFWYKHYGTNGTNPGSADNPSINMVKTVAAHPIFTGIEGDEFAVFNVMEDRTSGRYLQGNGSFADETLAQTSLGTTNGSDCIGEVWVGEYGYVIIPVDGAQPEGYLTEDGKQLFVNAVKYLVDGVKYEIPTGIDGVNATVNVLNGDIYTINGVKVRNAGDSLKGLAKGLYIINGKKLIVK